LRAGVHTAERKALICTLASSFSDPDFVYLNNLIS